jgi:2-polyprenyl-6-methoxyphenol hydroxylase-like FAD-dependent oxidoreductase
MMQKSKVLISGAGIAGLTLAILLKEQGYQPLVVERDKAVRGEGYMMDFFGSGWDVAERMGLAPQLHAIRYPIDSLQFVDASGGIYTSVPIDRVRRALDDKYVYLRRSDLERILYERAIAAGVEIRFGSVITALQETANAVRTTFVDGTVAEFALVFGADGVHSGVRRDASVRAISRRLCRRLPSRPPQIRDRTRAEALRRNGPARRLLPSRRPAHGRHLCVPP